MRPAFNDRRMASLGVIGAVRADAGNRLIGRYLAQQLGQHGRIAHAVVGHFDGPDLQRARVNAQMHLAPLTPVLGSVFLALPLAFAQELDAGAVNQQVQRRGAGPVGQLHAQAFLTPAHGAEVGHFPVQTRQAQQAFNRAQTLAQSQAEQAFDAQAELDRGVREYLLAPPLATGRGVPLHVFVQPDRERPSGLERGVVLGPVRGLVVGLRALGFSHARRLSARADDFVQQSREIRQ